jgi:hypothetical protein
MHRWYQPAATFRKPLMIHSLQYVHPTAARLCIRPGGGRAWWAHFRFTRINIALTIPKEKIEEHPHIWAEGDFLTMSAMRQSSVLSRPCLPWALDDSANLTRSLPWWALLRSAGHRLNGGYDGRRL